MSIVERLPMYGIHYYEVKDRSGLPWWLGISYKGISLYDFDDKKVPRRVFPWNQLENLYFRDRKFSVEVHNAKRASITRRAFFLSNVNVHSWTSESGQLTKAIWSMAIAQHQFYLDSKQSKLAFSKTMLETANDFAEKISEGAGQSRKIKHGNHARSLSASIADATFVPLPSGKLAERELFDALKEQKKALEEELQEKLRSLREICLREAAVTRHLPDDAPDDLKVSEFTLQAKSVFTKSSSISQDRDLIEVTLEKLEEDFRLQKRIASAYQNLVNDVMVDQQVHKSRQQSHHKALNKLKIIEKKLKYYHQFAGKPLLHNEPQFCASQKCSIEHMHRTEVPAACSSPDLRNAVFSDARQAQCHWVNSNSSGLVSQSQGFITCSKLDRHSAVDPAVQSGFTYPSLATCHPMDLGSVNNMALYNIRTHQTTIYDSSRDLDLLLAPDGCSDRCSNRWPSKHASLEGAYKKRTHRSGGAGVVHLDRNLSSGCLECHELFTDSDLPPDHSFISVFSDLADEEEPSIHTLQSWSKVELCGKCCKTFSSSDQTENSREHFGSCSCATQEGGNRYSCDMKEHCCPYTATKHSACCSFGTVTHCRQCSHCLGENRSYGRGQPQQTSSQAPKTRRRHISPIDNRQLHHASHFQKSYQNDNMVVTLSSGQTSNRQNFTNMSQTVETSDVCFSRHQCQNSSSDVALIRSCSVSRGRMSKRNDNSASGSGFSRNIPSDGRDITGNHGIQLSQPARSHSVHDASDF